MKIIVITKAAFVTWKRKWEFSTDNYWHWFFALKDFKIASSLYKMDKNFSVVPTWMLAFSMTELEPSLSVSLTLFLRLYTTIP